MKLNNKTLIILLLVGSVGFAQNYKPSKKGSVDIIPVPFSIVQVEGLNYNPNGIKLFPDPDPNFINLQFRQTVVDVLIEVIDSRGRLVDNYRGLNVDQLKFNTARLSKGQYYIRVSSNQVKDFLKFNKDL